MAENSKILVKFRDKTSKENIEDFVKKYDATIVRIERSNDMVITVAKEKVELLKKDANIKHILVFW